jgi:hypothetical protein
MTNDQLDDLVRLAAPITEDEVAGLALDAPERELLEAIVSTSAIASNRGRPRLRRAAISVAAAAILVVAVGIQQGGGRGNTAWAQPVLAAAKSSPRLLVGAEGWKVSRADELTLDYGETTFAAGSRVLDLHWQASSAQADLSKDRAASADLVEAVDVSGHQATLFRYAGTTDYTTIWSLNDQTIEARGQFATKADYLAVIRSLHQVDVDTWLRAMPASVVRPDARAGAVDTMLADMPKPPGFDPSALRQGAAVKDRYQLGAEVAGAVACGWIDRWVAATDAGDAAAAKQASDAMATSHHWAVLNQMNPDGDYPEVLWELADAMATNATVPGGRPMTIKESYRDSLGCGQPTP